jgi:O-succinylbenzoic acid--CoA ligase
MVTALHPREFRAGDRSSGRAMPHAQIAITAEGLVHVAGESVFRGYYPEFGAGRSLATADLGSLDSSGHLHILGRKDDVIITGGKKVDPRDVEAVLMATGEFSDVAVLGAPDPEWGQAVVACYPAAGNSPDADRIASQLSSLASYKRPRRFIPIRDWPRNAQGKLNRAALVAALSG